MFAKIEKLHVENDAMQGEGESPPIRGEAIIILEEKTSVSKSNAFIFRV